MKGLIEMRKNSVIAAVTALCLTAGSLLFAADLSGAVVYGAEGDPVVYRTGEHCCTPPPISSETETEESPTPGYNCDPEIPEPVPTAVPDTNAKSDQENVPKASPVTESKYIHGDVNLDGVIDVSDLTDLALILVDKKIPDDDHFMYGDVDYDGESTLTDLAIIRQFLSKKIPSLPESKAVSYASYEARKKAREQAIKPDNPPTPSAVPSKEVVVYPTGYFPLPTNAPGIMFGTDTIACKNTDQASEIISNYDTYNYSDNQKEFLAAMKSDGFLYAPDKTLDIAVTVNDECYLYATKEFGDINIEYCAKYRDFDYHVYICYADKEKLKNSESEKNYLMEHCSFTGSKFMKIKGTNMYYTWAGIVFFIDENHYCYIKTIDSRDNMLKFAENFSLKKISF